MQTLVKSSTKELRKVSTSSMLLLLVAVLLVSTPRPAPGQGVRVGPDGQVTESSLNLPYAFYNEQFGFAVGYVSGYVGWPQKQATLLATVIAGSTGSAMGFLVGRDLKLPGTERLFLDPVISVGYFQDIEAYIDGNPAFPDERSASNDSDPDNFVAADGWDNFFRLRFKYLLPMGHGRHEIISRYQIEDGILASGASGGTSFNPLASGKSYLEVRPFYRWLQVDADDFDKDLKTNGLDLSFFWDNRDFYANPTRGFGLRARHTRDFGWFDSNNAWNNFDGELDAYIPLATGSWLRQEVLALNLWSSYSPSWEESSDGTISNNPPAYTGSTLGGLWRMRGFPSQRFNDKAAIYYAAELRLIPHWNPFDHWPELQKHVGVQWIQLVPFVEVGRVAPHWNPAMLHEDMQWSAGLGLRVWAKGLVARVDAAYSEEGVGIQMMVSHPFQF